MMLPTLISLTAEPVLCSWWGSMETRQERPAPEDVTRGRETTSAKIRALAQAGYDRTEISEILGIRYQHVRKVLVDAGIIGGLRRHVDAEREPIAVDATPTPEKDTSWEVLRQAGFLLLGEWAPDLPGGIKLDAQAPTDPGVYAFVVNEAVVYVGLTLVSLRSRLDQYRRGHEGQRTNARVKKLIIAALAQGQRIRVMVATPSSELWNGLPVNVAAGLEAGLIQKIRPAWNVQGTT